MRAEVSVKVSIHPFLTHLTEDRETIEVDGSTVGEVVENLVSLYPALKEHLFGKDGKISNTVEIYVNAETSYPEELAKPVRDGDDVHILNIVTGG